jgi:hypothetical protein
MSIELFVGVFPAMSSWHICKVTGGVEISAGSIQITICRKEINYGTQKNRIFN